MKIQINDSNYDHFKQVFEVISTHLLALYPPGLASIANPIDIINNWESKSKTLAKRGLKSGLMDLISEIKEFPPELKIAINKSLSEKNLPSLQDLQGVVSKTIAKVLKRGKINSLEEFYIIKEEVIDLTSDLPEADRKILDKCLHDFEFSFSGRERQQKHSGTDDI